MERVSVIEGDTPVLILAPHGPDDTNTDYLAEAVAEEFGAFAVINRGFRRSSHVDYARDLVNCNNIEHLHSEVVYEEFLNPIFRAVAKIKKKYDENVLILILHGCSDSVRRMAGDPDLDLILGYGEGNPPSYSCKTRVKNAFAYHLQKENFGVYEGKAGGRYSGRSKNNLNQLFTQWYPTSYVNSLQLEIVRELRTDEEMIEITKMGLVSAIDALMLFDDTSNLMTEGTKKI
jgi:hypothetical protein